MFWLGDEGRGANTEGMGLMDYRMRGGCWRILAQSRTFWLGSHPLQGGTATSICIVCKRGFSSAIPGLCIWYQRAWEENTTIELVGTQLTRSPHLVPEHLKKALAFFPLMVVLALVSRKWRPYWRDLGQNEILSNCKAEAGWNDWNNTRPGQQDGDQGVIWSSHSPPRLPSL